MNSTANRRLAKVLWLCTIGCMMYSREVAGTDNGAVSGAGTGTRGTFTILPTTEPVHPYNLMLEDVTEFMEASVEVPPECDSSWHRWSLKEATNAELVAFAVVVMWQSNWGAPYQYTTNGIRLVVAGSSSHLQGGPVGTHGTLIPGQIGEAIVIVHIGSTNSLVCHIECSYGSDPRRRPVWKVARLVGGGNKYRDGSNLTPHSASRDLHRAARRIDVGNPMDVGDFVRTTVFGFNRWYFWDGTVISYTTNSVVNEALREHRAGPSMGGVK